MVDLRTAGVDSRNSILMATCSALVRDGPLLENCIALSSLTSPLHLLRVPPPLARPKVETEESNELVDAEDAAPMGNGVGGGLFGHAPRGMHGCAAVVPTSEQKARRLSRGRERGSPTVRGKDSGGREVCVGGECLM